MLRSATFTEANAWVHLPPESFARHFPSIRLVWQSEGGHVWVDAEDPPGLERLPARVGNSSNSTPDEEPILLCGCLVQVRYRPHARETICAFSNRATAFHTTLRISGRLMLVASALSRLHEAICVHPHDEGTVQAKLGQALSEARTRRLARKGG